jgi:hypothetical protein
MFADTFDEVDWPQVHQQLGSKAVSGVGMQAGNEPCSNEYKSALATMQWME